MKRLTAKLGNMKKAVEWVVCPVSNAEPNAVYIQSDKRICRFDKITGKGMLSNGKGHPGFLALSPILGAVEIVVPQSVIEAATGATPKSGDLIGANVYIA